MNEPNDSQPQVQPQAEAQVQPPAQAESPPPWGHSDEVAKKIGRRVLGIFRTPPSPDEEITAEAIGNYIEALIQSNASLNAALYDAALAKQDTDDGQPQHVVTLRVYNIVERAVTRAIDEAWERAKSENPKVTGAEIRQAQAAFVMAELAEILNFEDEDEGDFDEDDSAEEE